MNGMKYSQQIAGGLLATVLLRQLDAEPSSEQLMVTALIVRAFDDAVTEITPSHGSSQGNVLWRGEVPAHVQRDAIRFFFDGRMERWADMMGVASESVRCFARGLADRLPMNPLSRAFASA
jgi:hypothetical protein